MDVSAIVYFHQPATLAGIERKYASDPGNHPMVIFAGITPTEWKATLDPRHTAPIELAASGYPFHSAHPNRLCDWFGRFDHPVIGCGRRAHGLLH